LLEPDVPGPRSGAGTKQDTPLTFHQWFWKARSVAHHTIYDTVEQQLHLPWDVTPIAGRTHDNRIGILYHFQYPLRVILCHRTLQLCATGHTTNAGFDTQIVGIDCLHLVASILCFFSHDVEHLRNQTLLSRASVYD
jgi:hypothetical protein